MQHQIAVLAGISVLAVALNIPLGRFRAREVRFSFRWLLYVHLAIPVIAALRIGFHFSYKAIPILILASILGQIIGSRTHRTPLSHDLES